uniref:Uncharacterized protein n=1 Tax=Aegilops tauschii subsp. strangulata TaxID=200361 RepID=A0A453SHG5_AEGTS
MCQNQSNKPEEKRNGKSNAARYDDAGRHVTRGRGPRGTGSNSLSQLPLLLLLVATPRPPPGKTHAPKTSSSTTSSLRPPDPI